MAIENKTNNFDFQRIVERAIQMEIELMFEKAKEDFIKNLDKEKDTLVAGVLINMKKTMDIQTSDNRIIFTIREIKKD